MELAKNKESLLEDLAQREIDLANKTAGETKEIYKKMANETYGLFKAGIGDGDYKIDEKLLQVQQHMKELEE